MEWPLLYLAIFFLLSSSSHDSLVYASNDRLSPGKSISLNETLVSDGGAFALGFFPIGNSPANLYLAIRYNNIAQKTIVWVANREKPINVSLATLTISNDSNLVIMGSKGSVFWSSNVKSTSSSSKNSTPVAVLLNNGNLVLGEGSDTILWQSFDHPTDTFLPGMKFIISSKPHKSSRLISWKDPEDPSLGNFSCCARPNTPLQVFVWQGSEPHWRSSVWNGRLFFAIHVTNSNYVTYETVIATADYDMYVTYSLSDGSSNTRIKLDHSGQLQIFGWDYSLNKWIIAGAEPSSTCEEYGHCGPFGCCDRTELVPTCKCMEGFEPRLQSDWNRGNFSGGCVRRTALQCGSRDMFSILGSRKLPDQFLFLRNKTIEECKAECIANCSCNAYAYSNLSIGAGNISRCLVWMGELIDTEILGSGGENLYLRLVGSKLDKDDNDDQKLHVPVDKNKLIIIIVTTTCFSLFFLQLCLCILWKKKLQVKAKVDQSESLSLLGFGANVTYSSMSIDDGNSSADMSLLSLAAIAAATDNFSEGNKLGEGGFGQVYKGKLPNGQEVAIKRLSVSSRQGLEEFKNEVLLIARLQHMNLVRLLGFSCQGEEKMLIYEYMPNKSLDSILFDPTEGTTLDWSKRKRIIDGIAQGLLYLHKYSRLKVIHRDLKASNILLDAELNPKISDFGIARIFDENQEQRRTKRVVGTYGYMPPEYAIWGHFSEKTDVFSYGVLLLEIISGKKISCFQGINGSLNLLQYAWELWEDGRALELVDPLLGNSYCKEELLRCIHVGLSCVQKDAPDRPTMSAVISQLGGNNVSLPSPNQPAFQACEGQVSGDLDCQRRGCGSANDVTITMIEGR